MSLRSIQLNDLARMANTADAQLHGRSTADQNLIDAFNFKEAHGMSRQDLAERDRQRKHEAAHAELLEGFEGDPPASIHVNIKGLKPARASLAGMVGWRDHTAAELGELHAVSEKLQTAIDEPAAAEAKRSGLLREQAKRLLNYVTGREPEQSGFDHVQRRELDSQLDAAQNKADVARIALSDIEKHIAEKELQLAKLNERLPSYVADAVKEHANSLGSTYLEKIAEVRAVVEQLAGMSQLLGTLSPEKVKLPHFHLASLADSEKSRTIATNFGADKPWRELIAGWGVSPPDRAPWMTL